MDDSLYKEIEEFEKLREKNPFDIFHTQISNETEPKKQNENFESEFENNFKKHWDSYLDNPCVFNLVDIMEDVQNNDTYPYEEYFDSLFLRQVIGFLSDPSITYDNCKVLLGFFIALLEVPDTQFSYKLCDEGIIPLLYDTVMRDQNEYWADVVACLSLLLKNNYDKYNDEIVKRLFKPVLSSIGSSGSSLESVQASLLFAFSCCENYKLNAKRIKKLVDVLSYALQSYDYKCLYYALSALLFICRKYPDYISLLSTTKITMSLALFLPQPSFKTQEENNDIFSRVLNLFELIFKGDPCASYTFPFQNIFPRILDTLSLDNIGVVNEALDVIDAAICHFYGGASNLLLNGLPIKMNELITNSIIKIKEKILIIFQHLCQYTDPELTCQLLNDENLDAIFHFIHDNASSTFVVFAKSLISAITRCDEAGLGDSARESLLQNDIPLLINEVLEEIDQGTDDDNEIIESLGNQLLQLIQPESSNELTS